MKLSLNKLSEVRKMMFLCILTGIEAPSRDYSIPGSKTSRIFTTIGAAASLVFAFNTGMLPEIQVGPKF